MFNRQSAGGFKSMVPEISKCWNGRPTIPPYPPSPPNPNAVVHPEARALQRRQQLRHAHALYMRLRNELLRRNFIVTGPLTVPPNATATRSGTCNPFLSNL